MPTLFDRLVADDDLFPGKKAQGVFVVDALIDSFPGGLWSGTHTMCSLGKCLRLPYSHVWLEWQNVPEMRCGVEIIDISDWEPGKKKLFVEPYAWDQDRGFIRSVHHFVVNLADDWSLQRGEEATQVVVNDEEDAKRYWASYPTHDHAVKLSHVYLGPAFHALTMMNVKNARFVDVVPPDKLNKARKKRGKLPLVRHTVVEIDAFGPKKRGAAPEELCGTEAPAEPKALHTARGHYADYREGKGLFGKLRGLYWRGAHVRGQAGAGIVHKTYLLKGATKVPHGGDQ